jgi:hypothetical protein
LISLGFPVSFLCCNYYHVTLYILMLTNKYISPTSRSIIGSMRHYYRTAVVSSQLNCQISIVHYMWFPQLHICITLTESIVGNWATSFFCAIGALFIRGSIVERRASRLRVSMRRLQQIMIMSKLCRTLVELETWRGATDFASSNCCQ